MLLTSRRVLPCLFVLFTSIIVLFLVKNWKEETVSALEPESSTSYAIKSKGGHAVRYTNYTIHRLRLKELDHLEALQPEFGPVVNDVLSFKYLIDVQPEKCLRWTEDNHPYSVLIVVISGAGHSKKREAIRRTLSKAWNADGNHDLVFLVGLIPDDKSTQELVINERLVHADIVQVDFIDSYANLTIKSVALLHWVYTHCPNADYVLKSDDDNFINTNVFDQVLASLKKRTRSIYGLEVPTKIPERLKGQKHYISRETWPWNWYPFYLMGGAYVLSRAAIKPLLAAAQTTPYFPFEDVYISGLCAQKANVTLETPERLYDPDFPHGSRLSPCFIRNVAIWQTHSPEEYFKSEKITQSVYRDNLQCI